MTFKPEHIVIAITVLAIVWIIYSDYKNEGFCPTGGCDTVQQWPFLPPTYWTGREDRQQWGDQWYAPNETSYHPANPSIANYDNKPPMYNEQQRRNFGCKIPQPEVKLPTPTPFEKPGSVCLGCNSRPFNGPSGFQLADFPLPGNHEDLQLLPSEGAPLQDAVNPHIPISSQQNNGGNTDHKLNNLIEPEVVIQQSAGNPSFPPTMEPPFYSNLHNTIGDKIKQSLILKIVLILLVGFILYNIISSIRQN